VAAAARKVANAITIATKAGRRLRLSGDCVAAAASARAVSLVT
jgi:hypothetical protein